MASWHISRFEARPASAAVLRYGAGVILVAGALATALVLSYLAMTDFFIPVRLSDPSSESYLVIYGIFGVLVSWFSTSRRRAERLLTEARNSLEIQVAERTGELTGANEKLQSTQTELRCEKDRLKLLLD